MNNNSMPVIAAIAGSLIVAIISIGMVACNGGNGAVVPVTVERSDIYSTVATIGTVRPQNRLEIKPPINGRVEKILVQEGQEVKTGQVLAMMSSTERATLIDAARLKGAQEFAYWQKAYKETPLVAPIDGVVIVRDVEPGQTVGAGDAILVLSDRLVVKADVDETDIGELKSGQRAVIGLDAYPEIRIDSTVGHISYESRIVSNVTMYSVDIIPHTIPEVFRSGMSANVEVIVKEAKDALVVPADAVMRNNGKIFVRSGDPSRKAPHEKPITIGIEGGGMVEVTSGLKEGDTVYIPTRAYAVPRKKGQSTPFMPTFRRGEERPPR